MVSIVLSFNAPFIAYSIVSITVLRMDDGELITEFAKEIGFISELVTVYCFDKAVGSAIHRSGRGVAWSDGTARSVLLIGPVETGSL